MAPKRKPPKISQPTQSPTVTLGDISWPDLVTFLNDVRVVLSRNPALALEVQNVALKRLVATYQGKPPTPEPETAP